MAAVKRDQRSHAVLPARMLHAAGRASDPALQWLLRGWVPEMAFPSAAEVRDLVESADSTRRAGTIDEVLEDFAEAAAAIDRQASAQMTVGALSLTVVGLTDGVSMVAVIAVAFCALIGVLLAQFALLLFVGRMPCIAGTTEGALAARTLFVRKFGFVTLSQFFVVLAVVGAAALLVASS